MFRGTILFSLGSCLVVFGLVTMFMWPDLFDRRLQRIMILKEDSVSYDMWHQTPVNIPIHMSIFMFNITNVDEILLGNGKIKPRVEQLGPYVFRETINKVNISWNDNGTVSYYNQKVWVLDEERTNGSLSDRVTSINPTITSVANIMRHKPIFTRMGVDVGLSLVHRHQFLTAAAGSWLFEGIHDPIMEAASTVPFMEFDLPTRIGWFYGRNNSKDYEGEYLMNTGVKDFSRIGVIEKWRGSNRTPYGGACGNVAGHAGEFWSLKPEEDRVEFFAPDFCTSLVLPRQHNLNINGVDALLFVSDHTLFDNGRNRFNTTCYCESPEDCLPMGALNASLCYKGAPAFLSSPHFYGADHFYSSKVDGLDPNPTDEYAFQLALEPLTGMTLMVRAHVQFNLFVRRAPNILINNNLPEDTVLPVFWTRQELSVPSEYLAMVKYAAALRYGVPYALGILIVIGAVLLCVAVFKSARNNIAASESKQILEENSNFNYFPDKY